MISASAWPSRWAAGTAALLLAGGSALPGEHLEMPGPEPAPVLEVPAVETPEPVEDPTEEPAPVDPADEVPTPPPADEPAAEPPIEEPAVETPTEGAPAEEGEEPVEAGPVLVIVPEPVRTVVDGAPGYVLPLGDGGFTWLVDGVAVGDLGAAARLVESPDGSWFELSAVALGTDVDRLVLAVVAAPGHALLAPDGTTSLVRAVVDPRAAAELVAPTALDGEGRADAVVVPDVPGQVVRDAEGGVLDAGSHPVTAEYVDGAAAVTLTVTAAEGHRLEVDGSPVETLPGAGGASEVSLVLTDLAPVAVEPAPSPERTPPPTVSAPPVDTPARGQAEEQDTRLELAAPLVTVPAAVPEQAVAVAEGPTEVRDREELPESGPEGLGLMVMLAGLLLGGSWLILGMRGE
ncbi:hypothetical protein [Georgenia satyanarayanai]|uniref:hypothetical protein n=1 Tax=Georgenia satyanarayanai TaxID=860221 RepID=UPI0012645AF5|nr:hypothetical protein [Georgenia satyanarayanai]